MYVRAQQDMGAIASKTALLRPSHRTTTRTRTATRQVPANTSVAKPSGPSSVATPSKEAVAAGQTLSPGVLQAGQSGGSVVLTPSVGPVPPAPYDPGSSMPKAEKGTPWGLIVSLGLAVGAGYWFFGRK